MEGRQEVLSNKVNLRPQKKTPASIHIVLCRFIPFSKVSIFSTNQICPLRPLLVKSENI